MNTEASTCNNDPYYQQSTIESNNDRDKSRLSFTQAVGLETLLDDTAAGLKRHLLWGEHNEFIREEDEEYEIQQSDSDKGEDYGKMGCKSYKCVDKTRHFP